MALEFLKHDWKAFKDAFFMSKSEDVIKNIGQKANLKYVAQGLGIASLNTMSDWYANSPNLKSVVSDVWSALLPGDMNTGTEGWARDHLSISGFQQNVLSNLPNIDLPFTDISLHLQAGDPSYTAFAIGATLAGLSVAALAGKRIYNYIEDNKGQDYKLNLRDWILNPLKENKKSAALAFGGLLTGAETYISGAYKAAVAPVVGATKKSNGMLSRLKENVDYFLDNTYI